MKLKSDIKTKKITEKQKTTATTIKTKKKTSIIPIQHVVLQHQCLLAAIGGLHLLQNTDEQIN